MVELSKTKAGFVALVGATNAGKSTLINTLVGQKISIVTHKVQTTRFNMRGIVTRKNSQFIFVDTPGIYKAGKGVMDKAMVASAWQACGDADVVVLLVDAIKGFERRVINIIKGMEGVRSPIILVLNKIDQIKKHELLPLMEQAAKMDIFKEILAISALKDDGVDKILDVVEVSLPASPYLYDEDTLTDLPMRLLAAEITREQAYILLHQELPYELAVETVQYIQQDNGSVRIDQNIIVDRASQKGMVVGKGGDVLRKIGARARQQLKDIIGVETHLFLHVKVKSGWADNSSMLRNLGVEPGLIKK